MSHTGERQQLLHRIPAHLSERLRVHVEEAPGAIDEIEPFGREIRHAAEEREIDRCRKRAAARDGRGLATTVDATAASEPGHRSRVVTRGNGPRCAGE